MGKIPRKEAVLFYFFFHEDIIYNLVPVSKLDRLLHYHLDFVS
jgi:hypothetical protein